MLDKINKTEDLLLTTILLWNATDSWQTPSLRNAIIALHSAYNLFEQVSAEYEQIKKKKK